MISLYRECRDWTDPSYHRYMYLTHEVLVDSLVIVVQVGPIRLVKLSTLLADNVLGQLELFEGEGQGGVVGVVMIRGPRLIHITGHHSLCPVNSWHGHPTVDSWYRLHTHTPLKSQSHNFSVLLNGWTKAKTLQNTHPARFLTEWITWMIQCHSTPMSCLQL